MNDLVEIIGGEYVLNVSKLLEKAKEQYIDDMDWDELTNDFDIDYVFEFLDDDEIDAITKEVDYLDNHYEEITKEIEESIDWYVTEIDEYIEDVKWSKKYGEY